MPNIFTSFNKQFGMADYLSGASLEKYLFFIEDAIMYFDKSYYTRDPVIFSKTASDCLRNLNLHTPDKYRSGKEYNTAIDKLMINLITMVDTDKVSDLLWLVIFNLTDVVSNLKDMDKIECLFNEYTKRHDYLGYSMFLDILKNRNIDHIYQVQLANLCFDFDVKSKRHLNMLDVYLDIHKRCIRYIYEHNDDLSYKILAAMHAPELSKKYSQIKMDKLYKRISSIQQFKYPGMYDKYLTTAELFEMADNVDFWKHSYLSSKLTYSDVDISTLELC